MTAFDIAREYLPELDDKQLEQIIWDHTGYPHWWSIPTDGATPEECFRKQLADVREEFKQWATLTPAEKMERYLQNRDIS